MVTGCFYAIGTRRVVRKFFFWKTVNGVTRFLQVASWEEKYVSSMDDLFMGSTYWEWEPIRWLSEEERKGIFKKFEYANIDGETPSPFS